MEMGQQMFVNKRLLGLQRQWDPEWTLFSRGFPHHTESILSTEVSGVPLFWEQTLYANSFRKLRGRSKFLPESSPYLSLLSNNLYTFVRGRLRAPDTTGSGVTGP